MGLQPQATPWRDPVYKLTGKSILDIGGGPVSMLLKTEEFERAIVIDPCEYPEWVKARYQAAGIEFYKIAGEDLLTPGMIDELQEFPPVDEIWIYNVLQHTQDPEKIIDNARKLAKTIRIFEWINTEITAGHPHSLSQEKLDLWLGGHGTIENLNRNNCFGWAYYGVFNY